MDGLTKERSKIDEKVFNNVTYIGSFTGPWGCNGGLFRRFNTQQ